MDDPAHSSDPGSARRAKQGAAPGTNPGTDPDADLGEPRRTSGVSGCAPDADEPPSVEVEDPRRLLSADGLAWVRERAADALAELAQRAPAQDQIHGEVRVLIVDDERMARLHEDRAGVPGTTDVLTFDLAPDDDATLDTDIYVCADEARRRGEALGHDAERELVLYIVHGVLHCLGHDDHDDDAYARMHALEDEILGAIGVGATFDPERTRNADSQHNAGAAR